MDLASTSKEILACFRVKELKDVLMKLGLSTQGKKQDLVDRILDLLSNEVSNVHGLAKKNFIEKEGVAEIIDDVYRKLQGVGTTSASTNGDSFLEIDNMKPKEEVVEKEVRCPCCWSQPIKGNMIQCVDPQCRVLQHISCVIIPEQCSEGIPSQFYCEICRIRRADPFWETVAHPLSPVMLVASDIPVDGTNPLLNVEQTFEVTSIDIALLQNAEYEVQAWCILLNDKVPFRMQWPLFADLKVNGVPIRTVNRPGSQLLGANGRDDGPKIAFYLSEGINQISLLGCDARSFCLGVRLVKQRVIQQILSLIPKEQDGEPFEDALARICRSIGGGMAMANDDSDDDLEVIADSVAVNLRCPMSGGRIKTAGRFRSCQHIGCFDLETFVQLNQRSRKWQCPICLKNYCLEDIIIDPYINRITNMMQDCGEDVTEIDVKPDGSWRVKDGYQFKNLGQWHLPDGTMCVATVEIGSNLEASGQMRKDGITGHINTKQVTMRSTSYESYGDDGDQSISKDGTGHFDISANNGREINSISYNINATAQTMNINTCGSPGDNLDVIVLSDSEEENANFTSLETVSLTPAGLFNSNDNDFEMSHLAFASGTRVGSEFQLFHTDRDASDALIDLGYTPVTSSTPRDGYTLNSKCTMDAGTDDSMVDVGNNHWISNGIGGENLTSFGLGSNSGGGNGDVSVHAKPTPSNQFESNEASVRPGMNNGAKSSGTTNGKRSSGPFSFPRQPRSARRPHLP
ncbi:E3 SUMO-protein ligase SIZ1-like [Camellia sinensis]|uniref:E3 SUMO-protein ligase SIZ1-like n=1 Tax=Camellia sinensis TaxID=4442 RepID=UPI00103640E1|nr:E3 SUMO-protein ligase SIZ1-like [Camellia sinensis]